VFFVRLEGGGSLRLLARGMHVPVATRQSNHLKTRGVMVALLTWANGWQHCTGAAKCSQHQFSGDTSMLATD